MDTLSDAKTLNETPVDEKDFRCVCRATILNNVMKMFGQRGEFVFEESPELEYYDDFTNTPSYKLIRLLNYTRFAEMTPETKNLLHRAILDWAQHLCEKHGEENSNVILHLGKPAWIGYSRYIPSCSGEKVFLCLFFSMVALFLYIMVGCGKTTIKPTWHLVTYQQTVVPLNHTTNPESYRRQ